MTQQRTLLDGNTGAKLSSLELLVGAAQNAPGGPSARAVGTDSASVAEGGTTITPPLVAPGFGALNGRTVIECPEAGVTLILSLIGNISSAVASMTVVTDGVQTEWPLEVSFWFDQFPEDGFELGVVVQDSTTGPFDAYQTVLSWVPAPPA